MNSHNKDKYKFYKNLYLDIPQYLEKNEYLQTINILKKDITIDFILCVEGIFIYDYNLHDIVLRLKNRWEKDKKVFELTNNEPIIEKACSFDEFYTLSPNYHAIVRKNRLFDITKTCYNYLKQIKMSFIHGIEIEYSSANVNYIIEEDTINLTFDYEVTVMNENNINNVKNQLEENYRYLLKKKNLII